MFDPRSTGLHPLLLSSMNIPKDLLCNASTASEILFHAAAAEPDEEDRTPKPLAGEL